MSELIELDRELSGAVFGNNDPDHHEKDFILTPGNTVNIDATGLSDRIYDKLPPAIFKHCILAGGAINYMLINTAGEDKYINDYDLFIIANSEREALEKINAILSILGEPYNSSSNVLNIRINEYIKVQIILIYYPSILAVLDDFDFGACMFAFDGKLYTNTEGNEYYFSGISRFNINKFRYNTVYRLAKYRHGTAILFPNYYVYTNKDITCLKYLRNAVIYDCDSPGAYSQHDVVLSPLLHNLCELNNGRKNYKVCRNTIEPVPLTLDICFDYKMPLSKFVEFCTKYNIFNSDIEEVMSSYIHHDMESLLMREIRRYNGLYKLYEANTGIDLEKYSKFVYLDLDANNPNIQEYLDTCMERSYIRVVSSDDKCMSQSVGIGEYELYTTLYEEY